MNQEEFTHLLEKYNAQLERANVLNMQSWALHLQTREELASEKAKRKLRSLGSIKWVMVLLGVAWVYLLFYILLQSWAVSFLYFKISAIAIIGFNLLAIGLYLYHIVELKRIDFSESILDLQTRIYKLQLSTIQTVRILFLQAPFYTTFWWNTPVIVEAPLKFWLISVPVALIFVFLSLWLFRNISEKNVEKKWFKILFNSPEWNHLVSAKKMMQFVEELREER